MYTPIRLPKLLMPREGIDLSKWAVIACDQYTSQPDYWNNADAIVGDAPSTLRLTLPEVYLEPVSYTHLNRSQRLYISIHNRL